MFYRESLRWEIRDKFIFLPTKKQESFTYTYTNPENPCSYSFVIVSLCTAVLQTNIVLSPATRKMHLNHNEAFENKKAYVTGNKDNCVHAKYF